MTALETCLTSQLWVGLTYHCPPALSLEGPQTSIPLRALGTFLAQIMPCYFGPLCPSQTDRDIAFPLQIRASSDFLSLLSPVLEPDARAVQAPCCPSVWGAGDQPGFPEEVTPDEFTGQVACWAENNFYMIVTVSLLVLGYIRARKLEEVMTAGGLICFGPT